MAGQRQPESHDAARLAEEHQREAIRRRLMRPGGHSHLGDAMLGAVDGCVTTLAVVAAATGGGFSNTVILVLGFANLLADALSMAASNYQDVRTQQQEISRARATEHRHIETVPEGEKEELRQIFEAKGLHGDLLEQVVETITANREVWVDVMLTDELGLRPVPHDAGKAAAATFGAFLIVGAIPLLPFVFAGRVPEFAFAGSVVAGAVAFFSLGAIRGRMLGQPLFRGGLGTLFTGGGAAFVAWLAGTTLRSWLG